MRESSEFFEASFKFQCVMHDTNVRIKKISAVTQLLEIIWHM